VSRVHSAVPSNTRPDGDVILYPTEQEVRKLGCCICGMPASAHHIIGCGDRGVGMKSKHMAPLCPRHHNQGNYRESVHAGHEGWEDEHGRQVDFVVRTREALGYPRLPLDVDGEPIL